MLKKRKTKRRNMESRIYQTRDLDFQSIAQAFQRSGEETVVQVGASDWVDQIAVGAVGLILYPLLVTAAVGAVQQRNVEHFMHDSINQLVRQQQPHVSVNIPPPTNPVG
jgi:hypothetical protein